MSVQDKSQERILNGQCWDDLCDTLKQAERDVVMADGAPNT